uniref:Uncharacterized protein n=1 Tax=Vespula pensylvanica TaxID=30213 RepID=A0A834UAV0_VESPE|nr:hypothetical protein H0235_006960 [Vespula pensylvanica]
MLKIAKNRYRDKKKTIDQKRNSSFRFQKLHKVKNRGQDTEKLIQSGVALWLAQSAPNGTSSLDVFVACHILPKCERYRSQRMLDRCTIDRTLWEIKGRRRSLKGRLKRSPDAAQRMTKIIKENGRIDGSDDGDTTPVSINDMYFP